MLPASVYQKVSPERFTAYPQPASPLRVGGEDFGWTPRYRFARALCRSKKGLKVQRMANCAEGRTPLLRIVTIPH